MTERGLPIVDGAPACPFVAFDDDRDERAAGPDHRHRCYAETPPAPRALAHQEAYCLSSAFPVCPTFQDWARREAARARADAGKPTMTDAAAAAAGAQRNPPRNWAAPPPWLAGGRPPEGSLWAEDDEAGYGDDPGRGAPPPDVPRRGRGLSGSYADRVAADADPDPMLPDDDLVEPPNDDLEDSRVYAAPMPPRMGPTSPPHQRGPFVARPSASGPAYRGQGSEDDPGDEPGGPGGAARPRRRERDTPAPEWERAKPLEAYPTLRSRRLSEISVPPILVAVVALALSAAVLFALPGLLGFGGPGAGASSSPTTPVRTATPSVNPTPVPQPTPVIYVVQSGDTLSRIAGRFGISLGDLIAANADTLPNPDKLQIGDRLVIPVPLATEIPAASVIPGAS
jgi:LysM domain